MPMNFLKPLKKVKSLQSDNWHKPYLRHTLGLFAVGSLLGLSGCASLGGVTPTYVSPTLYANYACNDLAKEYNRVHQYLHRTYEQNSSINTTGIGVGISGSHRGIYPTFSVGLGKIGVNSRNSSMSQLFGERDAIIQAARIQKCSFADKLKLYDENDASNTKKQASN